MEEWYELPYTEYVNDLFRVKNIGLPIRAIEVNKLPPPPTLLYMKVGPLTCENSKLCLGLYLYKHYMV